MTIWPDVECKKCHLPKFVAKYLGYFFKELCSKALKKFAQSGHDERNLDLLHKIDFTTLTADLRRVHHSVDILHQPDPPQRRTQCRRRSSLSGIRSRKTIDVKVRSDVINIVFVNGRSATLTKRREKSVEWSTDAAEERWVLCWHKFTRELFFFLKKPRWCAWDSNPGQLSYGGTP